MAEHKNQNGFTLVEAVITTAIVALMSALVLTGTNGAKEKFQVRNAAQQLASSLREAITMTKNGVNAAGCTPSVPPVSRECSKYQIVIPTAGGDTYDRKVIVSATDYGKATFTLPGGAKFLTNSDNATVSFGFVFPGVSVSGSGGATVIGNSLEIAVGSKRDPNINAYVCVILSNGAVGVQQNPC